MDGSDEPYTLQAESRCVQVCVIFGRSLLCKIFWAGSGDVQAEAKMRRLLGKVGRIFVRVKKAVFWENSSAFRWET